ncbi:hypothetical protein DAEQUDRAFT_74381 [Daedalea quercina L-15889]|uniref:F-box domain-containing protein n=1 Tax=Daedalea quercina L-15889 TaxID=1314783 RepID=A0A165SDS6_9APHY|nr:hypothetical protein DAEQUDRAFT_74381 [Daedalea quercina L-15889]
MKRTIISPCKLAFDTWDDIIALLAHDLPSVAACTLTCHAFLPASRTHVFRVACIDSPKRLETLEALLGASPALARNIRTLEIRATHSRLNSDPHEDSQAHCTKKGWPRLVRRLEHLTCVRLEGFALELPDEVKRFGLPGVQNLWMKYMRSVQDDLRSFVLACPQLSSLYIDETSDVAEGTLPLTSALSKPGPPSFSRLDTLVWHVPSLPLLMQSRPADDAPVSLPLLIVNGLQSGQVIPLRRLAVGHNLRLSGSTRSTVKKLVASAGDALESLVLRLEDLGEGRSANDAASMLLPELCENHRLKALHILGVGSAWFEVHDGLSAITYVLSTVPTDQDALEDVVVHLTPYVPRAQRDWSLAAWVQLVDALIAFMRVHPRVRCMLCLDFSSNFGERPKPVEECPITAYVEKLVQALPFCQVDEGCTQMRQKIGLIWQTHFRDWECAGDEVYPGHNYVGEAMGAPEWYYRLRY